MRPIDTVVIHEMPLFAEHIEPSHTRNPHITMLNSKNVLITGGTGSFGKSVHKTYSGEIQPKKSPLCLGMRWSNGVCRRNPAVRPRGNNWLCDWGCTRQKTRSSRDGWHDRYFAANLNDDNSLNGHLEASYSFKPHTEKMNSGTRTDVGFIFYQG